MKVPFNVLDFLDRAEHVYGDRFGVVDEPDQPADSWGQLTWRQVAEHARAMAAGLDALGIARGERVAIVSHNSARLLAALFGVSGFGRVVVPINFRLNADEVRYIVEQSGASVLLIDPELDDVLADVDAPHRFVLGREDWPSIRAGSGHRRYSRCGPLQKRLRDLRRNTHGGWSSSTRRDSSLRPSSSSHRIGCDGFDRPARLLVRVVRG